MANPHTPIFDVIQDFDIVSLQGDLFIAVVTDHSLRSNKPLGQVIVPLSVLTKHMGEMETTVTISGWFELFPVNKITKYNGGGKYVPFMKDIPLTSGLENSIGLPLPEKVALQQHMPLLHLFILMSYRINFCCVYPSVLGIREDRRDVTVAPAVASHALDEPLLRRGEITSDER